MITGWQSIVLTLLQYLQGLLMELVLVEECMFSHGLCVGNRVELIHYYTSP